MNKTIEELNRKIEEATFRGESVEAVNINLNNHTPTILRSLDKIEAGKCEVDSSSLSIEETNSSPIQTLKVVFSEF